MKKVEPKSIGRRSKKRFSDSDLRKILEVKHVDLNAKALVYTMKTTEKERNLWDAAAMITGYIDRRKWMTIVLNTNAVATIERYLNNKKEG